MTEPAYQHVTPARVAAYLGRGGDTSILDLAAEHVAVITSHVHAYTRGNGFSSDGVPCQDLAAVIVAAAARSLTNPQALKGETLGAEQVTYANTGFTLPEQAVLNLYRKRAA
ncbi:MAG: hypothetical protein E7Z97_07190 [Propionibacteriaceae bacterium]|nr:hypothetical protein [Propionibacteriaceae bacterium]